MKMNKNWKELGFLGMIIYILSLPILIWKSSKIGKLIFIFILISIMRK